MNEYLISEEELQSISLWNRRYFETTEFFISTFSERVENDVETLPECTKLDSLKRYLDIYKTAHLNFTNSSKAVLQDKYRDCLQVLADTYGELVMFPTLRKVEYIEALIGEETVQPPQQGGVPQIEALPPQQTKKPKPELNDALISFSSTELIESLHSELKGYFQGKEAELKKALQGKQLKEFLLFPHNQNKFVEVFKRLKYNGFLLSTPKETKDWICSTFTYQYQKGSKKEVREFNTSTVHDILTKDKGEPTKKERICIVDWLPYKSRLTRQREAEKESI